MKKITVENRFTGAKALINIDDDNFKLLDIITQGRIMENHIQEIAYKLGCDKSDLVIKNKKSITTEVLEELNKN